MDRELIWGNLWILLAWTFLGAQKRIVVVGLIIADLDARMTSLRCNIAKFIHRMTDRAMAIPTLSIGRSYQGNTWNQRNSTNGER